ncbi:MAG: hypothetical protein IT303_00590 [Dehalococcoidia bacterium]|nr:hypothetical protein [Dehalococcoidia bacterium]
MSLKPRLKLPAIAVIVGLFTVGCDDPTPNFGVFLNADGRAEVVYKPCDTDALIYRFAIQRDAEVIWEIESQGSQHRAFVLGDAPPGFNVVVPLQSSLEGNLRMVFTTSELKSDSEVIAWSDIEQGRVLVPRRGFESQEQFDRRDGCESRGCR